MRQHPSLLRLTDDLPAGHDQLRGMELLSCSSDGYLDHAKEMLGFEPDYGHLTAYMIRRFGYPNRPGDPDKDLTGSWRLATGKEDLILTVRPTPSGNDMASLNFVASVPMEAIRSFRTWLNQPRDAWRARIFEAVEAEGLPHWMPAAVSMLKGAPFVRGDDWRDVVRALPMFQARGRVTEEPGDRRELARMAEEWAGIVARHAEVIPDPGFRERIGTWQAWDDSDPQKPYMEALQAAFDDLKRPVFVRDVAIGLGGVVRDEDVVPKLVAEDSQTSVYPVGCLVHNDAEAFGELLSRIHKLGAGDMGDGVRAALRVLEPAEPEASASSTPEI